MSRTSFRNLAILIFVVLTIISGVVFWQSQKLETTILEQRGTLSRLQQELENATRLTAALSELDQLTINENNATQLDILRHLGLEQAKIDFSQDAQEQRRVGDTTLFVHNVRILAHLPYPALLNLADRLHNTKKIVLNEVVVQPIQGTNLDASTATENLELILTGRIYGLSKNTVANASPAL